MCRSSLPEDDITDIHVALYDECEIHRDCTVEIWRNSVTGDSSIGWYPNDKYPGLLENDQDEEEDGQVYDVIYDIGDLRLPVERAPLPALRCDLCGDDIYEGEYFLRLEGKCYCGGCVDFHTEIAEREEPEAGDD